MPLSEHEQRQLEQIEQALYREDPKFGRLVRSSDPRVHYKRKLAQGIVGVAVGGGLLAAGVVAGIPSSREVLFLPDQFLGAHVKRVTGRAKVLDATTLLLDDGTRIRLLMRAPGPGEAGAKPAAEFLAGLIADRPVTCFLVQAQYAWTAYVGDVNIEHAMIINGWARSHHGSTRPAETIAREKKRGLWADR